MSESDVADDAVLNESATGPSESVAPRSGLRSDLVAVAPERRRSSIRPVSPAWRPPSRSDRPLKPMVVVYSGDSQGPPIDWESTSSSGPATARETPAEPFYLPRNLPLPSIPDFEALAPPIFGSAAEPAPPESEGVAASDGKPVAAYAPGEIDALVAYELARAEFRAELETPSVRREVRVSPAPLPVAAPMPASVALEPAPAPVAPQRGWPFVVGGLAVGVVLAVVLAFVSSGSTSPRDARAVSSGAAFASALASEALAAPASTPQAAEPSTASLPSSP